jgi:hypothetical protein
MNGSRMIADRLMHLMILLVVAVTMAILVLISTNARLY